MKVKILGPLEVLADDGTPVDLGRRKQRALLAMLVVEVNRVVPIARLIELLWTDAPPARVTSSIQTYVSDLRRLLETHRTPRSEPEVLVTQPPGYMLRLAPTDIDASAFESLVQEGARLLSDGRPDRAREALVEALELWRGPAFGEFAGESFVRAEAGRLEELRLAAVEGRLEADMALGNHAAAIAELDAAVTTYPLRERLYGLHMVALYRAGRQAEALRTYQRAKRSLGELGLEPGPALRALEADVLAHASSLDWQPPGPPTPAEQPASSASPPSQVRRSWAGTSNCRSWAGCSTRRATAIPGCCSSPVNPG